MIFRLTMKMAILAVVVAVFYVVCSKTFEYGAAIFSEEAMAPYGKGVDVVVTIPNDTSTGELGKICCTLHRIKGFTLIAGRYISRRSKIRLLINLILAF